MEETEEEGGEKKGISDEERSRREIVDC